MKRRRKLNTSRYYPADLRCGLILPPCLQSPCFPYPWVEKSSQAPSLSYVQGTHVWVLSRLLHTHLTESSTCPPEVLSTVKPAEAWAELFTTALAGREKRPRGCEVVDAQEESHKGEVTKTYGDCLAQRDTNWKPKPDLQLWMEDFNSLSSPQTWKKK